MRIRLWLFTKLSISLLLIAILVTQLDGKAAFDRLVQLSPLTAMATIGCFFLQALLMSWRWRLLLRIIGFPLSFKETTRNLMIGLFFNQTLPSSIGGDVARVLLVSQRGIPMTRAATSVMFDRACGLFTLLILALAGQLILPIHLKIESLEYAIYGIAVFSSATGLVVFFFDRLLQPFQRWRVFRFMSQIALDGHTIFMQLGPSIKIFIISLTAQLMMLFGVYILARGLQIEVEFGWILATMPVVFLIMAIPISIAGWGVREGIMVVVLGTLGIASSQALALSILLGLMLAAVGLPGGALWAFNRLPGISLKKLLRAK